MSFIAETKVQLNHLARNTTNETYLTLNHANKYYWINNK